MSKSYGNTIPLFAPRAQLQKQIASIVTDSRAPGEPKDTEGSALFQIYQAFASAEETETLRKAYAGGIGWGDAKQLLFERIDQEVAPLRARYDALMNDPAQIERILLSGAAKAQALSKPFMASLRHAVGLRNLAAGKDAGQARAAKGRRCTRTPSRLCDAFGALFPDLKRQVAESSGLFQSFACNISLPYRF